MNKCDKCQYKEYPAECEAHRHVCEEIEAYNKREQARTEAGEQLAREYRNK